MPRGREFLHPTARGAAMRSRSLPSPKHRERDSRFRTRLSRKTGDQTQSRFETTLTTRLDVRIVHLVTMSIAIQLLLAIPCAPALAGRVRSTRDDASVLERYPGYRRSVDRKHAISRRVPDS
jgi:hypothetical protein